MRAAWNEGVEVAVLAGIASRFRVSSGANGFQWFGIRSGADRADGQGGYTDLEIAFQSAVAARDHGSVTLAYAIALARSCLAALADAATDFNESVQFEHLLLALDALHPDGPALYSVAGDRGALLDRLDAAVDRMQVRGGDLLSLELLAALAHETIWAN